MTEGFDSLVDRLMAMEGLDRDEAEALATARFASLTAGALPTLRLNGRSGVGRGCSDAPAVSDVPAEEGQ